MEIKEINKEPKMGWLCNALNVLEGNNNRYQLSRIPDGVKINGSDSVMDYDTAVKQLKGQMLAVESKIPEWKAKILEYTAIKQSELDELRKGVA